MNLNRERRLEKGCVLHSVLNLNDSTVFPETSALFIKARSPSQFCAIVKFPLNTMSKEKLRISKFHNKVIVSQREFPKFGLHHFLSGLFSCSLCIVPLMTP